MRRDLVEDGATGIEEREPHDDHDLEAPVAPRGDDIGNAADQLRGRPRCAVALWRMTRPAPAVGATGATHWRLVCSTSTASAKRTARLAMLAALSRVNSSKMLPHRVIASAMARSSFAKIVSLSTAERLPARTRVEATSTQSAQGASTVTTYWQSNSA